jgi:hypothetical protein
MDNTNISIKRRTSGPCKLRSEHLEKLKELTEALPKEGPNGDELPYWEKDDER